MSSKHGIALAAVTASGLFLLGCHMGVAPEVQAVRQKYLSSQEPAAAMTLTEAKEKLVEEAEVTVLGRVGSGGLDPFDKSRAIFVLSEAPVGDHAQEVGHDAAECVFCRRKMEAAPLAHVELCDEQGATIQHSAKDLLGLSEGQIVVVRGRGKYDKELDTVMLAAKTLFIRTK